jgi:hypothetical protein
MRSRRQSCNGIIRSDSGNALLEACELTYTQSRNLGDLRNRLNSVGWFVPPYFSSGLLDTVAWAIARRNGDFTQADLEGVLAGVYDAERLASMVLNRYHTG